MVVLADVDRVVQEDDEQVGADMDELVGGEGEVDVLGRLLPLNVDGLFVRLGRLPVQRS